MTICAYCDRAATATIIAVPDRVCSHHLLEFWTGLLDYAHGRAASCVKPEGFCPCITCEAERLTTARTYAPRRGRMSEPHDEGLPMRLAS